MTKEDIIRMAREADFHPIAGGIVEGNLLRFAALVASAERESLRESFRVVTAAEASAAILHEREACARLAEMPIGEYEVVVACGTEPAPYLIPQYANWQDIAKAIRARGQA